MSDTRCKLLIDRIAANEAGAVGFSEFRVLAKDEPQAWERLACALRDELQLRASLQEELDADRADAEIAHALSASAPSSRDEGRRGDRSHGSALRLWSGWAVAAIITIAWSIFALTPHNTSRGDNSAAQLSQSAQNAQFVSLTADDAFEKYLELGHSEGRIVQELPARMIDTQPADDGGLVVYYIRQLLERERVGEVYQYAEDDTGRPSPIPVDLTSFSVTDSAL